MGRRLDAMHRSGKAPLEHLSLCGDKGPVLLVLRMAAHGGRLASSTQWQEWRALVKVLKCVSFTMHVLVKRIQWRGIWEKPWPIHKYSVQRLVFIERDPPDDASAQRVQRRG